jgi:hypothetical protein
MSKIYNASNNENIEESINDDRYIFWIDDFTVLYKNHAYINFIPTSDMTRVEQLNALSRFFIYLIVLLLLFSQSTEWLYIPIIGLILTIILYNIFDSDEKGKREELIRMKNNKTRNGKSNFLNNNGNNNDIYDHNEEGKIITINVDNNQVDNGVKEEDSDNTNEIEAGFEDSGGNIRVGKYRSPFHDTNNELNYTMDDIRLYEKAKCRRPTTDNPFMNPSIADFNKDNVPVACNSDDKDVGIAAAKMFSNDIYKDIEDVYDRKNSQRQFYTIAHNIPNDQDAFVNWCYRTTDPCKINPGRCMDYQDLRFDYHSL